MKTKIINFFKSLILKENNKISISKSLAWIAGVCASIVAAKGVLIANGVGIPAEMLPVFKWATIISGLAALIRIRNSKSSV